MKKLFLNCLLTIGVIITLPVWVVFVIIILFSIPKDYDKNRSAEDEMFGF